MSGDASEVLFDRKECNSYLRRSGTLRVLETQVSSFPDSYVEKSAEIVLSQLKAHIIATLS